MAADKEAINFNISVTRFYEIFVYSVPEHINITGMHTISGRGGTLLPTHRDG